MRKILWAAGIAAFCFSAAGWSQSVTIGTPVEVSPKTIKPSGSAPRMKVQLLSSNRDVKEYAVIFYTGDEAFSGLARFAQEYHVTSAHFTAIGAIAAAKLGWFDAAKKIYRITPYTGQMEVASMSGDIAEYQGKPAVHAHAVLGMPDGSARAGHVVEMQVRPTLEVMVTVDPIGMQKRFDPDTDLTLIDPKPE
ncbi:PPC domain-containing DNA-binding protein [Silvibacterium sp.]|uniref:PPC domain-containing DNA-binding protein n=1 Tax=Silvibacterium sp. TaxID=1964179 RepID=UPI0039E719C6